MDILQEIDKDLHTVKDSHESSQDRLIALNNILQYMAGLQNTTNYDTAVIMALIDHLEKEVISEYIIGKLAQELREILNIPLYHQKAVIVIGKNWAAQATKEYLKKSNFCIISEDKVDWMCADKYEAVFMICERNTVEEIYLQRKNCEQIVRLYIIYEIEFLRVPFLKKTFEAFEKGCERGNVECLVTGLSYGRDGVHPDLMARPTCSVANSAQDLYNDFLYLKYACEKMESLQYVISTIAPYSLRYDESLAATKNNEELFYYTIFRDVHHNNMILSQAKEYECEKEKIEIFLGGGVSIRIIARGCIKNTLFAGGRRRCLIHMKSL